MVTRSRCTGAARRVVTVHLRLLNRTIDPRRSSYSLMNRWLSGRSSYSSGLAAPGSVTERRAALDGSFPFTGQQVHRVAQERVAAGGAGGRPLSGGFGASTRTTRPGSPSHAAHRPSTQSL